MTDNTDSPSQHPRVLSAAWFSPRRATGRLIIAAIVGVAAFLLTPGRVELGVRAVVGWDVGAFTLIALAWSIIARADAKETARRASAEDPGRTAVWAIAIGASLFSLFAAMFVLRRAHTFPPTEEMIWGLLGVLAVALSWILTHTSYTLRYAHLYYSRHGGAGLEFPGGVAPTDIDFAYFSFTLGMCFQTSDVLVTSREFRKTVLAQSLLSFIYNTMILALSLNFAFGLLGS